MTIEEAIAILEALYRGGMSPNHPNPKEALKLGSEALKRFQRYRKDTVNSILDPLPGETE